MGVQILNKDVSVISSIANIAKARISNVGGIGGWAAAPVPGTSGPNYGSTATSDNSNGGVLTWSNPTNANSGTDSDASATTTISSTLYQTSHYLKITGFGFSIPSNATINGITVVIRDRVSSVRGSTYDVELKLVKGGIVGGDNKANTGNAWSTSFTQKTYGSATDLWGQSWTPADINASDFGIVFSVRGVKLKANNVNYVDYIRITIDYTA